MKHFSTLIICCIVSVAAHAQHISDSLIQSFKDFYTSKKLGYEFKQVIHPVIKSVDQTPDGDAIGCFTNKEVLVVALIAEKTENFWGQMLVAKKYNGKTEYDKHAFQDIARFADTQIYFSLLDVQFPPEANNYNCHSYLQVYDKDNISNEIVLLVFVK